MDTSYLSKQVSHSIGQLHSLFDDIGVPDDEREARESEVRWSFPPWNFFHLCGMRSGMLT